MLHKMISEFGPHSMFLLLFCWVAMFGIADEGSHRARYCWSKRESFFLASTAWGSVLTLITEVLSAFGAFQGDTLVISWVIVFVSNAALYVYLLWLRTKLHVSRTLLRNFLRIICGQKPVSVVEMVLLAIIALQILTLGMVAYQYPPNNVDSINYHLARVMHWQQQRSVAYYASDIDMQTFGAPFSEFVLLHLQILTGGDRFANLVQWFAMVICVVGVSYIAAKLGADRKRQIIGALLTVSIPMGILQATSTQNDYVVASWLVIFISLSFALIQKPEAWAWRVGTGLALGLALLTKATAFIYAGPFCIFLGFILLRRRHWQGIIIVFFVFLLAATINIGCFSRNIQLTGWPIRASAGYTNRVFSFRVLASNIIRNIAIHVPINSEIILVKDISRYTMSWLRLAHAFTGLNPVDPVNSMTAVNVFLLGSSFHEDLAGNPLHLFLISLALAICGIRLARRNSAGDREGREGTVSVTLYVTILFVIFCLFSFYLLFQIWQSRLQLPHFVLWCPAIAIVLFASRPKWILSIPIIVGIFSFNWTFNNATRPISIDAPYAGARANLYFVNRPDLLPVYTKIVDAITGSNCHNIGLTIVKDPYEYPIWVLLKERKYQAIIQHVRVAHPSGVYKSSDFRPDAVISAGVNAEFQDRFIGMRFDTFYLYLDPQCACR